MKIILILINNFLLLKYNIHIFQQNYYMPDTHLRWLKDNFIKFLLLFLLTIASLYYVSYLPIFVVLTLINIYISIERNVIKKIVYTSRVKRLFITNYIIFIILYLIFRNDAIIGYLIINSLSGIYMILINYLNLPVNKLINLYYINDAKKILKSMPNLKIIAITGSYGKTSTKNYLGKMLSLKYNTLITPGNFNTTLGITRTIREHLKPTHEIFICEIGIDRVGQIEKTINLIKPDYAVITAIGAQHLETFKTVENIINSKMALTNSLPDSGISFLNLDNDLINNYPYNKEKIIGYGLNNNLNNKLSIKDMKYTSTGITFNLVKEKNTYEVKSSLLGEHNLINLYGAITIADYFEVPIKNIINETRKIKNAEHRLELKPGADLTILDDSYNSNPEGAKNALKVLKEFDGLRILITPGMVELGEKEDEENYEFGTLASICADYIYLINEKQTKSIYKALIDSNYDKDKLKVCDKFLDAFEEAKLIKTDKHKYILIENDLPDNYN